MIELQSTITCPHCGHRHTETMPTDFCQFFYDCEGCAALLRPKPGDCCVFCSYGTARCPPVQEANERGQPACCQLEDTPIAETETRARSDWADWSSNRQSYVLAWGLPTALLIVGIFAPAPVRTVVWAGCLIWMGVACLANATRCGRTHCHLTGPFYLAMAAVAVGHGAGMISLGGSGMAVDRRDHCRRHRRPVGRSRAPVRQVPDPRPFRLTASTRARTALRARTGRDRMLRDSRLSACDTCRHRTPARSPRSKPDPDHLKSPQPLQSRCSRHIDRDAVSALTSARRF